MFSAHFDAKQCRDSFQQPQACDPSPVCSSAFRSNCICSLLLELDSYGGNYHDGMVPHFYKQGIWELASKLAVIFRHLVRGGSFPACWRLADVVPVPKESASTDVGDYRPISVTLVLSTVFENIVAGKLSHFWK